MRLDKKEIAALLPHREPMLLIDELIDVNKLKYSEVKTMKSGSKQIYVNYGSEKLTIQTPSLYLPYGITKT